jgi:fumarylacetoacetase
MHQLNETHARDLLSWVESANDIGCDFPIQNLPFGVCQGSSGEVSRVVVAIGDQVLDMAQALTAGLFEGLAAEAAQACRSTGLNDLMALGPVHQSALRLQLSRLLRSGSQHSATVKHCLSPMAQAHMLLPAHIGDFSDFFTSIHHATNSGRLARPDNPLMPNFKHIPVAYHSRASSIVVSGTPCPRPMGQTKPTGASRPVFGPTRSLDFECEIGFYVGQGTKIGESIPLNKTHEHIFGLSLLNDWSARDMQAWESQPLGPFLAKSFMTSISPWIITLEALAPFRMPAAARGVDDPDLLPYLNEQSDRAHGGLALNLEISLQSQAMKKQGSAPYVISRPKFQDQYWTLFQMLAHQTSNGCNMLPGDLIGSGTVSGPREGELGCLKEMTADGKIGITLPSGETRTYLEAGDEVVFRGRCEREGYASIGFGQCSGIVMGQ